MGHFLKLKCAHSPLNLRILSSTSVLFTLMTVQVPNLALTHTKRITVYVAWLAGSITLFVVPARRQATDFDGIDSWAH